MNHYRGLTKDDKWVHGYLAADDQIMVWDDNGVGKMFEVITATVGQWTGLKDKNEVQVHKE